MKRLLTALVLTVVLASAIWAGVSYAGSIVVPGEHDGYWTFKGKVRTALTQISTGGVDAVATSIRIGAVTFDKSALQPVLTNSTLTVTLATNAVVTNVTLTAVTNVLSNVVYNGTTGNVEVYSYTITPATKEVVSASSVTLTNASKTLNYVSP